MYYNTEPIDGCFFDRWRADEVWDYSWHNILNCKKHKNASQAVAQKMRYVPAGYVPPPPAEPFDAPPGLRKRVQGAPRKSPGVVFFGYPHFTGRRGCWGRLVDAVGAERIK